MLGLGPVGLALGAISTVSSLLESAAAGIGQAAGTINQTAAGTQAAATGAFEAAPAAPPKSAVSTYGAPRGTGIVIPKFDERTQAALLAFQEMHRGA